MLRVILTASLGFISAGLTTPAAQAQQWSFTCGGGHNSEAKHLTKQSIYSDADAWGWDRSTAPASIARGSCVGNGPFFFSLAVPEGNYRVKVVLGSKETASVTTVKAEARRLMVDDLNTPAGKFHTEEFVVNVRTPQITLKDSVHLKPREIGNLDWDRKLTLEFNGDRPSLRSIEIKKVTNVVTVYLAGDSTVVDQDQEPWAAWGQMLPLFFTQKVAIANEAESGETIHSFVSEKRLDKILSNIQPGDYLFIQFAHNDQKPGRGFVSIPVYKDYLRTFIHDAQQHDAYPVLVTSMNRRIFDTQNRIVQTLGGYPEAMRAVAKEQQVPLIDLNAMSETLFNVLGRQGTLNAFVHYPAHTFPGQNEPLADNTHFNSYGAYELARCVVDGIVQDRLTLADFLRKWVRPFDPAHPDSPGAWHLPASPMVSTATPYER